MANSTFDNGDMKELIEVIDVLYNDSFEDTEDFVDLEIIKSWITAPNYNATKLRQLHDPLLVIKWLEQLELAIQLLSIPIVEIKSYLNNFYATPPHKLSTTNRNRTDVSVAGRAEVTAASNPNHDKIYEILTYIVSLKDKYKVYNLLEGLFQDFTAEALGSAGKKPHKVIQVYQNNSAYLAGLLDFFQDVIDYQGLWENSLQIIYGILQKKDISPTLRDFCRQEFLLPENILKSLKNVEKQEITAKNSLFYT